MYESAVENSDPAFVCDAVATIHAPPDYFNSDIPCQHRERHGHKTQACCLFSFLRWLYSDESGHQMR